MICYYQERIDNYEKLYNGWGNFNVLRNCEICHLKDHLQISLVHHLAYGGELSAYNTSVIYQLLDTLSVCVTLSNSDILSLNYMTRITDEIL